MKLVVSGGRKYEFTAADFRGLDAALPYVSLLIHGDAPGADQAADLWAILRRVPRFPMKADWPSLGRKAGPIRNRAMAKAGDAVILFPGGHGTASMHREAMAAGLTIYDWRSATRAQCPREHAPHGAERGG